jgi:Ni/Co efflux regulator RcnB
MEINMRNKTVSAIALVLAISGGAFAQGNSQHQRHNDDCPNGNCPGQDNQLRAGQNARRSSPPQQQSRNAWQDQYHRASRDERGAGPDRSFRQGGRLPPEYRGRQFVVDDWRGHRLSAPPRGYHWVQNGGDYLLVAITTGVILQLLLSN